MAGQKTSEVQEGTQIGRYRIERRLGAGGMGVVYRAQDTTLGRTVAIKFLPAELGDAPERRARFLHEARAASKLDHENVGTLHGIEETEEGTPYLVMACYEGSTLAERLRSGPMGTGEALEIAIQTARGLREAHAAGILHRDIKPANLMLTPKGVVKIVDFGLAKLAGDTNLTVPGTVMGTAAYLSPEQARGEATDERADIWSLSVVLYEMVTGRAPYSGEDFQAVLRAILTRTPDLELVPDKALRRLLERAFQQEPRDRFQTADELLAGLEDVRSGMKKAAEAETIVVAPKSAEARRPAAGGRVWWMWAAAGILVIAAVLLAMRFWPAGEKSVAVLPFDFVGGSESEVSLKDGLQETLTSKLNELERYQEKLWVVPASEVRRSAARSASDVGRAFGANLAVTGSVQRAGAALRLSLNLVDARTLRQLGSAVVDEPAGDWLRLQDRAVGELGRLLSVRGWDAAAQGKETVPREAYESYLRAVGLLQRWDKTKDLSECRRLLEEVTARAPGFSAGRVTLANAYWTSYTQDNDPAWVERAREQIGAAQKLVPGSATVHETMGRIRLGTQQRDLAVIEFQEALKLDPRSQIALSGMARAYEAMGRKEEAEAAYRRGIAARPMAWNGYNNLGTFYYRQRRLTEAEAQYRKGLTLTPDNPGLLNNLGNTLKNQGRMKEAAEMFERSLEIEPNYISYQNFGTFYYQQSEFARSVRMFEKALALNPKDFRVWGSLGTALLRSGGSAERQREVFGKAAELGEQLVAAMPSQGTRSLVAEYEARLGEEAKARRQLAAITPGSSEDAEVWLRVALVRVLLGEREAAELAVKMAARYGATQGDVVRDPEMNVLGSLLPKAGKKSEMSEQGGQK